MSTDISTIERINKWFDDKEIKKRGRIGEIAKATGYSSSMVAKILTGHADLSDRFVAAICNAYGIDKQWVQSGIATDLTTEHDAKIEAEAEFMTGPDFDRKEIKFEVFGKDYFVFKEAINELLRMNDSDRWEAVALLKKITTKLKSFEGNDFTPDYPPKK